MRKVPTKTADEYDAFTGWRRVLFWQRKELKKIKRGYNKRVRREGKKNIKEHSNETDCSEV